MGSGSMASFVAGLWSEDLSDLADSVPAKACGNLMV